MTIKDQNINLLKKQYLRLLRIVENQHSDSSIFHLNQKLITVFQIRYSYEPSLTDFFEVEEETRFTNPIDNIIDEINRFYQFISMEIFKSYGTIIKLQKNTVLGYLDGKDHAEMAVSLVKKILKEIYFTRSLKPEAISAVINSGIGMVGFIGSEYFIQHDITGDVIFQINQIARYIEDKETTLAIGDTTYQFLKEKKGFISFGQFKNPGSMFEHCVYSLIE